MARGLWHDITKNVFLVPRASSIFNFSLSSNPNPFLRFPKELTVEFNPLFNNHIEYPPLTSWELPNFNYKDKLLHYFTQIGLDKFYNRYASCGTTQYIRCKSCGNHHAIKIRCGLRICAECADFRFKKLLKQYGQVLVSGFRYRPKFLTLTLRNTNILSTEIFRWISHAFLLLRRRLKTIRGGIRTIELTKRGNGWHVHLHTIIDMPYTSQKLISKVWKEITGCPVVDIRRADNKAIMELIGYSSKFPQLEFIRDYVSFLKSAYNVRLVQPFGFCLNKFKKITYSLVCKICQSTSWELDLAYNPNENASLPPPIIEPKQITCVEVTSCGL